MSLLEGFFSRFYFGATHTPLQGRQANRSDGGGGGGGGLAHVRHKSEVATVDATPPDANYVASKGCAASAGYARAAARCSLAGGTSRAKRAI